MTRKLVVVNMSNWADEAYKVWLPGGGPDGQTKVLRPGEYAILNTTESEGLTIHPEIVGESNGYEPPEFPMKVVELTQERPPTPTQMEPIEIIERKLDLVLESVQRMDPGIPKYNPPQGR